MEIWISNKHIKIATKVHMADSFFKRLKGWMGKTHIEDNEALILSPCSSIHTFGMRHPIDVLFLDKENAIIFLINNMSPWKISPIKKSATKVVELKNGTIDRYNLEVSDSISINGL